MAELTTNIVAPDDPGLISEMVDYPGEAGNVRAYVSRPKDADGLGAVVVIHENQGLVEHIKDVARRFAKHGFVALAPDLLSRAGGTSHYRSGHEATDAIRKLEQDGINEDLLAGLNYLRNLKFTNGRVGVVGYCWGGGHALNFATKCKELNAAVVYYGRNPDPVDLVQHISCPVLGNYGEDDPNIMPGVEPLKEALKKSGKNFDIKVYPAAKHAFNDNTRSERYQAEAARDAWDRTVSFLQKQLA